jgi:hypothetical protein
MGVGEGTRGELSVVRIRAASLNYRDLVVLRGQCRRLSLWKSSDQGRGMSG